MHEFPADFQRPACRHFPGKPEHRGSGREHGQVRPLSRGSCVAAAAGRGGRQGMGVYDTYCLEWRWRFHGRLDDEEQGNGVEKSEDSGYEEHSQGERAW